MKSDFKLKKPFVTEKGLKAWIVQPEVFLTQNIFPPGCGKGGIFRREPEVVRPPAVHAAAQAGRARRQQGGEVGQLGHRPRARLLSSRVRRDEDAGSRQVQAEHLQLCLGNRPGLVSFSFST